MRLAYHRMGGHETTRPGRADCEIRTCVDQRVLRPAEAYRVVTRSDDDVDAAGLPHDGSRDTTINGEHALTDDGDIGATLDDEGAAVVAPLGYRLMAAGVAAERSDTARRRTLDARDEAVELLVESLASSGTGDRRSEIGRRPVRRTGA